MSTETHQGKFNMSKLVKNPIFLVGVGVVAGYCVHKYRKEIIASATELTDKGKDFVLNQKENLEDLVAESKQPDDKT